jgi:biopolymer transport protein TolR
MAMNGWQRCGRRQAAPSSPSVMAEINVTPMVDVMLVLLIIFMVSARLDGGRTADLPQTQPRASIRTKSH